MNQPKYLPLLFSSLLLSLSGCAVNTGDDVAVMSAQLQSVTTESLQHQLTPAEQQAAAARVAQLLQQQLTLQQAVEVAILNNPSIQAELWALGIAQADLRQLSTMPNPGIKISRETGGDGSTELEFGVNLLALLTLPKVRDLAQQDYAMARIATAQRIAQIIHNTKLAYWQTVAAAELLTFVEKVQQSSEASAELAKRMADTGNFNKLQFLREQSLLSDSTLNLVLARQALFSSREKLKRQLGLWQNDEALQLPQRLPSVPQQTKPGQPDADLAGTAQQSLDQRLDVQLAKLQLTRLADQTGLTRATRLVNVFEVEAGGKLQHADERSYSLIFELPLFDAGQHRLQRGEAQYQQAVAQATSVGIQARSELQQSFYNYQVQRDIALHYQQVVLPLAQQIAEENQLLYNGMFISVFDLLTDARSQIGAVTGAIHANRDFWIATAELEMAQIGAPGSNFPTQLLTPASRKAADH
jgi:outer membrane protein TolC